MGLFGPSFAGVWEKGVEAPGVIVGIRVREKSEDESTYILEEYAVEVGGELLGIRQKLHPRTEVRLGMPVTVARTGKDAVIKWGQASSTFWKQIKPPARGIDDTESLGGMARRLGKPVTIEILSIGTRAGMLGLTTVNELQVRVTPAGGAPYDTAISKVQPAHYASHLFAAGKVLPGFAGTGKPRIDWQSAALAEPGVGVASPFAEAAGPAGSSAAMARAAGAPQSANNVSTETSDDVDAATAAGLIPAQLNFGFLDKLGGKLTEKIMGAQAGLTGANLDGGSAEDDPVSWEKFLEVSTAIKKSGYGSPAEMDAVASMLGVIPGTWADANARWMGRIMKDWKLGAAYGQAIS